MDKTCGPGCYEKPCPNCEKEARSYQERLKVAGWVGQMMAFDPPDATIDPDIITAMQHNINLLTDNLVQLSFRLTELEEKGKMRAHLDRDLLICALVKADLAIDYIPARPRTRTNIEAAIIAADVVMKMLDQEKDSGQDRR